MAGTEIPEDFFVFYRYTVSVPAAAAFVVLFSLTTVYHCYQLLKTRRWNMISLIVGGFMSLGGYAARIISHQDQFALGPYIGQQLLLLLAPVMFAATIYMTLAGTIISSVAGNFAKARHLAMGSYSDSSSNTYLTQGGEPTSRVTEADIEAAYRTKVLKIPVRWITRIFVTADIISLCSQGGGGGLMATAKSLPEVEKGEKIILAGLFFQLIAFTFFLVIAITFDMSERRRQRVSALASGWMGLPGWRKVLIALYAGSGLLMVRNTFRIIEYIQGNNGYLLRTEIWLYIFDALLMFILMAVFNAVHPGEALVQESGRREAGNEAGKFENGNYGQGYRPVE